MPTAAAVIIGNEILTGKFPDENGPWLTKRCRELGLDLIQVSIIADTNMAISDEVGRLSKLADWVFTTGGIGPTHDDVTMKGIATAFGLKLSRNEQLSALISNHMGDRTNADALRMADVPEGAELWQENGSRFPVVVCRNVLIFPGVPAYFQGKFNDIAHRLGGSPVMARQITTHLSETAIAQSLREASSRWTDVSIGSYPRFDTTPRSVIVTLDARNSESLEACHDWIQLSLDSLGSTGPGSL